MRGLLSRSAKRARKVPYRCCIRQFTLWKVSPLKLPEMGCWIFDPGAWFATLRLSRSPDSFPRNAYPSFGVISLGSHGDYFLDHRGSHAGLEIQDQKIRYRPPAEHARTGRRRPCQTCPLSRSGQPLPAAPHAALPDPVPNPTENPLVCAWTRPAIPPPRSLGCQTPCAASIFSLKTPGPGHGHEDHARDAPAREPACRRFFHQGQRLVPQVIPQRQH